MTTTTTDPGVHHTTPAEIVAVNRAADALRDAIGFGARTYRLGALRTARDLLTPHAITNPTLALVAADLDDTLHDATDTHPIPTKAPFAWEDRARDALGVLNILCRVA